MFQADEVAANLRLVVVDTVTSVIAPILGGGGGRRKRSRGSSRSGARSHDGHALMMLLGHRLRLLAKTWDIAVVVGLTLWGV